MSRGRFSFVISLVLILLCVSTCRANTNQTCRPSSCGHIRNISFPFQLKTDPNNCGHPSYELECDNNQTILYFDSKRYYVQSISYKNYTIRILDSGIIKNQCSSFPLHSLTYDGGRRAYEYPSNLNEPVIFISCTSGAKSSLYVDTASCSTKSTPSNTSSSSSQEYSYVLLGRGLRVADLEKSCKITAVAWFSSEFSVIDNTSLTSIIDTLANGFSLRWYRVYCGECEARSGACFLNSSNLVECDVSNSSPSPTINRARRLYNRLRSIWLVLPDFWGVFTKDQYRPRHYLGPTSDPVLVDYCWVISTIVVNLVVLALLARFLLGISCLVALLVYKRRRQHLSIYDSIEDFLQGQNNLLPIRYKYRDIKKMTNNFKDKLGEGGYGCVFKGKLRSGIFVAVKMTNKSKATGQDFINEVATIGRIHHVNVVQLIGFCVEGSKRALIYEFMPSGSLEKYIFSPEERTISLSYEKMFEISIGVARGINYLHRGYDMQILHFDIKPHNILLDQNFTPKISDFGLAKLYPTDDSIVSLTAARGTMGYMAPELFYKNIGGVSYKADVYSYGMLLMEMAGRRKNLNPFAENVSQIYFPSWVYDQFSEGKEIGMGYTSGEERKMVKKMILVALWCIQMKPSDRPSMNKIVEMLEGDDEHLQMPPKPFLYPEELPAEDNEIHANDNELSSLSGNYIDSTRHSQDES